MSRLVVIEPMLDRGIGHRHAFAAALPAIAAARGLDCRIYGGSQVAAELAESAGIVPLFRPAVRRLNATKLIAGPLLRLMDVHRQMVADLGGEDAPRVGADDLVLLPTADPCALIAVADWLSSVPVADRPRVAATIHEAPEIFVTHPAGLSFEALAQRAAHVALTDVLSEARLRLTATNDRLAQGLARHADLPISTVPVANPVDAYACDVPADRRCDARGRPRVSLLGLPRLDKGNHDRVPEIAAALAERLPGAWLLAQMATGFDRRRDMPASPAIDRANLYPGALPDDIYARALRSSAVVVVPYDGRHYRARVSGIFVDAAAAGCVTVAPAGTWMADRIAAGEAAGTLFEAFTTDAIAAATADAVDRLPALAPVAARCAARWLKAVGPAPYLDAVLATFTRSPARGGAPDAPA